MASLYIGNAVLNIILGKYTCVTDIPQVISHLCEMIVNNDIQQISKDVNSITTDATLSRVMSNGNMIRIDIVTTIIKDDVSCVVGSALLYNTSTGIIKILN